MDFKKTSERIQNIYFIVSITMVVLSIVLFILGYVLTQNVIAAPDQLINFAALLFNYHYLHVILGFGLLIYYQVQKKKHDFTMKILKTVLGLILSPFSYMILFIGILLLGLSSCAGSWYSPLSKKKSMKPWAFF